MTFDLLLENFLPENKLGNILHVKNKQKHQGKHKGKKNLLWEKQKGEEKEKQTTLFSIDLDIDNNFLCASTHTQEIIIIFYTGEFLFPEACYWSFL